MIEQTTKENTQKTQKTYEWLALAFILAWGPRAILGTSHNFHEEGGKKTQSHGPNEVLLGCKDFFPHTIFERLQKYAQKSIRVLTFFVHCRCHLPASSSGQTWEGSFRCHMAAQLQFVSHLWSTSLRHKLGHTVEALSLILVKLIALLPIPTACSLAP